MYLLSEVRTPQQVLNFAINREGGQADQQNIESTKFHSHKSTPKIDEAAETIKALNEDTSKPSTPDLVFL